MERERIGRVDANVSALDVGAWYSSLSIQLIFSGSHAGTVAANVPPTPAARERTR